jgi:hypothetical protein
MALAPKMWANTRSRANPRMRELSVNSPTVDSERKSDSAPVPSIEQSPDYRGRTPEHVA